MCLPLPEWRDTGTAWGSFAARVYPPSVLLVHNMAFQERGRVRSLGAQRMTPGRRVIRPRDDHVVEPLAPVTRNPRTYQRKSRRSTARGTGEGAIGRAHRRRSASSRLVVTYDAACALLGVRGDLP